MTSVRIINQRPYTNPTIKNPTYPTVTEYHKIVEMTAAQRGWEWPDRVKHEQK